MKDQLEICKEVSETPYEALEIVTPIAEIIYENVFMRDSNYCDWNSASYKAPEQMEGFAFHLCYYVALKIHEKENK